MEKVILNFFRSNWYCLSRCLNDYHTGDSVEMIEVNAAKMFRPWFPETIDPKLHYAKLVDMYRGYYVDRDAGFLIYCTDETFILYCFDHLDGLSLMGEEVQLELSKLMEQYWEGRMALPNEALIYCESIAKSQPKLDQLRYI